MYFLQSSLSLEAPSLSHLCHFPLSTLSSPSAHKQRTKKTQTPIKKDLITNCMFLLFKVQTVSLDYLIKLPTMDPVKIEKLQAMRRYKSLRYRFLINLAQYCLSLVCFGIFLSSPLWLPKLFSAVRYFFFVLVPGMGTYLFCPKCFFLLGNAIVIFLVGESKLSGAAPTPDIYDEYVERSKSCRRTSQGCTGKEKVDADVQRSASEENARETEHGFEEEAAVLKVQEEEEEEEEEEVEEKGGDGWEEEDGGDECLEGEEDGDLPDEELNRRIEDFIARVNKQRRLELLACSG